MVKNGDEYYEQFDRSLFSDKTIDLNDLMVSLWPGTHIQESGGISNLLKNREADINLILKNGLECFFSPIGRALYMVGQVCGYNS